MTDKPKTKRGRAKPFSPTCYRGHVRPPLTYCKECKTLTRAIRLGKRRPE